MISPSAHSYYTGMIPGFVSGTYDESALAIDVDWLTRAAGGGTFYEGSAAAVAADGRSVTLDNGDVIECDLVSADVGSEPSGMRDVPGAAEHTFTARSIDRSRAGLLSWSSNTPLHVRTSVAPRQTLLRLSGVVAVRWSRR